MEEYFSVYSEKVKVPLFHVSYEVIVASNMKDATVHAESMYPGLKLSQSRTSGALGYSFLLKHDELGNHLCLLVGLAGSDFDVEEQPSVLSTIVHEAVHLSWYIMDIVGIEVNAENNEIQAYLIEDIVRNVNKVVKNAEKKLPEEPLDEL